MGTKDYVIPAGEIYFAPFIAGTQTPRGERYIGNTPGFTLSANVEQVDHYDSDSGTKQKDDSATLSIERSGSLTTDNINADNLALLMLGTVNKMSASSTTVTDEPIADVEKGLTYQLGVSASMPTGVRGLDVHTVGPPAKKVIILVGSTEKVEGTDYTIDMDLARLTVLESGTIANGDDLKASYKTKAQTREQVISGNQLVEGQLRLISKPVKGKPRDYLLPWAKLSPNGEFQLKSETWQEISLNIEVLVKQGLAGIYADGRAVTS